jgi:hypothetical protein
VIAYCLCVVFLNPKRKQFPCSTLVYERQSVRSSIVFLLLKYNIMSYSLEESFRKNFHTLYVDLQRYHFIVFNFCSVIIKCLPVTTFFFYHLSGNLVVPMTTKLTWQQAPFPTTNTHSGEGSK